MRKPTRYPRPCEKRAAVECRPYRNGTDTPDMAHRADELQRLRRRITAKRKDKREAE